MSFLKKKQILICGHKKMLMLELSKVVRNWSRLIFIKYIYKFKSYFNQNLPSTKSRIVLKIC